ncbi:MAG: hypothetical protein WCV70_03975 [Patescibacteria group bacterium]|jgi:hypothetical protein
MKIFKFLLLIGALFYAAAAFAQTQQIFLVEIQFNRGQVKIGEVMNGQGYVSEPEKELEIGPYQYWLEMISSSGQVLDMRKLSLDPRVSPRPPYPGEITEPINDNMADEFSKTIALPYYPDVQLLSLYDANKNLLDQKDVSYLIPGCGDAKCGEKENYLVCASDCPAGGKDGWCNKGLADLDPDCPKTEPAVNAAASEQKPPLKPYILLVGGGLVIFLIIAGLVIYLATKRKTENL